MPLPNVVFSGGCLQPSAATQGWASSNWFDPYRLSSRDTYDDSRRQRREIGRKDNHVFDSQFLNSGFHQNTQTTGPHALLEVI